VRYGPPEDLHILNSRQIEKINFLFDDYKKEEMRRIRRKREEIGC
jgi:hypothetical protein